MVVKVIGIDGNRVTIETDFTDVFNTPEVEITVGKAKNKRSLNANAYFHVLVSKIADKMRISKPRCKNILLSRYGQYEMHDGDLVYISVLSDIDMMEREDIHCSPVAYRELNGKQFTHYAIMKHSHDLDSYEFAKLLDGTIDEANDLGIETITPAEKERMLKEWKNYSRS